MAGNRGDIVPGAGCSKKHDCVPFQRGCSGEFCKECRANPPAYLYYFSKDWREKEDLPKSTSFKDATSHKTIRTSSGCTFSWKKKEEPAPKVEEVQPMAKRGPHGARKVICETTGEIFPSLRAAARKYDLDESSISKCCNGINPTCGGKKWRYYG